MTENAPVLSERFRASHSHCLSYQHRHLQNISVLPLWNSVPTKWSLPLPLPSRPAGMFPFPPCNTHPDWKLSRPCEFIRENLWFLSGPCSTASFHRLLSRTELPWCCLVHLPCLSCAITLDFFSVSWVYSWPLNNVRLRGADPPQLKSCAWLLTPPKLT